MAVKEIPYQFESHGRQFVTRAEAERHSALIAARQELEDAQRKFQKLLAESATTADGYPFEFRVVADYWQLVVPLNRRPYLNRFTYWSWGVRELYDRPDVVEIRDETSTDDKPGPWVPIRDLYRWQENAEKALLQARRDWLVEQARLLADEEKALGKK